MCQDDGYFNCYPGACVDESFDYHCNCSGTGYLQLPEEISIFGSPGCEGEKATLRNILDP